MIPALQAFEMIDRAARQRTLLAVPTMLVRQVVALCKPLVVWAVPHIAKLVVVLWVIVWAATLLATLRMIPALPSIAMVVWVAT